MLQQTTEGHEGHGPESDKPEGEQIWKLGLSVVAFLLKGITYKDKTGQECLWPKTPANW